MNWIDKAKAAVFEGEDKKPVAKSQPTTAPAPYTPAVSMNAGVISYQPTPITAAPVAGPSDKAYQQLFADSDLNNIPEYAKFMIEVKTLESVIPMETTRFQAAIATLTSHGALDKSALLGVFDTALHHLDVIQQSYAAKLVDRRKTEIEDKTQHVNDLDRQIAELNAQKVQALQEISQSQMTLQQKEVNFNTALNRRRAEIQAEQGKFVAVLGS